MLNRFRAVIQEASVAAVRLDPTLGGRLVLRSSGEIVVSYAPFEHIERRARIVIVGITPGAQQAANALISARADCLTGRADAEILSRAKTFGSFSGPMRGNLVAMLDHVGLNRLLGISSTSTLWDRDAALAHFTSAQRFPVFVGGENYNGNPRMTRLPILRQQLDESLAEEAAALPNAIWVPLGPKASEGVAYLVGEGLIDQARVLDGFQHPSGANNERIAYFLGRLNKRPSAKTNPATIDVAKQTILARLASL